MLTEASPSSMPWMRYLFILTYFFTSTAFAWGERGHNTVGYIAALATQAALTAEEKSLVGSFFIDRTYQLGHLNNIPDIAWIDRDWPLVVKLNGPTHYLDAEALLGVPQEYNEEYLNKLRNLEKDYKKLLKQYDGKPSPLPGAENGKINFYFSVGTAPWRAQELFEQMVEALKCAKVKEKEEGSRHKNQAKVPFKSDAKGMVTKLFKCERRTSRLDSLYAALVYGGIMGHFVADLAQPFHCTADFDGWVTGQGGIHGYFESALVHSYPEDLKFTVSQEALQSEKNKKIWQQLSGDPKDKFFVVQTLLNLTADSLKHYPTLQKMDRELAVTKEGEKRPWGSRPGKVYAERKSSKETGINEKFRPIIVDRLTVGSIVLSHLWIEAWRQAGRPTLSDISAITLKYPLNVPFLKPSYAPAISN